MFFFKSILVEEDSLSPTMKPVGESTPLALIDKSYI